MKSSLKIAATGFVEARAGSVASANAILLWELLRLGHEVTFFSKSSFVDPRPLFPPDNPLHSRFSFVESTNWKTDRLRQRMEKVPVAGFIARQLDTRMYQRILLRSIAATHQSAEFDLVLWLGEYACGRIAGLPSVSFVQGPPGTDARSILRHWKEIRRLTPALQAWRWRILAALRLSRLGLPKFGASDQFLVGSRQSAQTLHEKYRVAHSQIACLPYPIDLEIFHPQPRESNAPDRGTLRALWLGRIIPRKRLDLFLNGAALAIRRGLDVRLTVVGEAPMFPGCLRLLEEFPFPAALEYCASVDRAGVPALFARQDVLVQPSEEENFGSSVAEAQACGLPVVVGQTNGNADYLAERDICLADDRPETLADALHRLASQAGAEWERGRMESRRLAERHFASDTIALQLEDLLRQAAAKGQAVGEG